MQVYEDTTGLRPGSPIYSQGEPLSVELGPGLMGSIYDGVQRPLNVLKAETGVFVSKGVHVSALNRDAVWHFVPSAKPGDSITGGAAIGTVQETEVIQQKIMVSPRVEGEIVEICEEGDYHVEDTVAKVRKDGREIEVKLYHKWPVRIGRPYAGRLPHTMPLITG